MLSQHSRAFSSLIHAFDLVVVCACTALGVTAAGGQLLPLPTALGAAVATLTWTTLATRTRLYRSRRTTGPWSELPALIGLSVAAIGTALLPFAALGAAQPVHLGLALGAGVATMGGLRLIVRGGLGALRRHGLNTRTVLLVGRSATAARIVDDYRRHPDYGIEVLGDLAFSGETDLPPLEGIEPLGPVSELGTVLRQHSIDEVLLCPSDGVWITEVRSVLRFLQEVGLRCRVAPDFLGLPTERTAISTTGDVATFVVNAGFRESGLLSVKRAIDIVGAGCGLLVLAPLLLSIAIAIKLTSRGPVLFRQNRLGLNCRPFTILKFRSMRPDAEKIREQLVASNEQSGPVFKIKDDPRVTRVGRLLRKYSLDELPQLINVLRGDMSIVGPRPPLPSEVLEYDWWQRRRLSVRPGLTCIWQVSGRNAISFDRWMELDMQYIDGWSLGMDLKIMAKTVREVLQGGGA